MKKFRRVNQHAKFLGVCGGLAYMIECPVWIIRLLLVVSILSCGVGILPYLLIGIFAPKWEQDPEDFDVICNN